MGEGVVLIIFWCLVSVGLVLILVTLGAPA